MPKWLKQLTRARGSVGCIIPTQMDLRLFDGGGGGDGGDPPARGGFSAQYVQELRDEAAGWRTKLRTAEEARDDFDKKLKTANQKVTDLEGQQKTYNESICKALGLDPSKAKAEEITAKITEVSNGSEAVVKKAQDALKKSVFMAEASKAGVKLEALEDAFKLADLESVKVDLASMSVYQVDADGKQITKDGKAVAGLEDLAKTLVKEKPYLVGKALGGVGGAGSPGGGGQGSLTPEEEGKQIAEERQKAKQAAQGVGGFNPWAPPK